VIVTYCFYCLIFWPGIADALLNNGDYVGAPAQLTQAKVLNPNDPQIGALILTTEGKKLRSEKDYAGAIKKFRKAQVVTPKDQKLHGQILWTDALILQTQGNLQGALADYKECKKIFQYSPLVDKAIAQIKAAIGKEVRVTVLKSKAPSSFDGEYLGNWSGDGRGTIKIVIAGERLSGTFQGNIQDMRAKGIIVTEHSHIDRSGTLYVVCHYDYKSKGGHGTWDAEIHCHVKKDTIQGRWDIKGFGENFTGSVTAIRH